MPVSAFDSVFASLPAAALAGGFGAALAEVFAAGFGDDFAAGFASALDSALDAGFDFDLVTTPVLFFLGRVTPYDPAIIFPLLVFLSPFPIIPGI